MRVTPIWQVGEDVFEPVKAWTQQKNRTIIMIILWHDRIVIICATETLMWVYVRENGDAIVAMTAVLRKMVVMDIRTFSDQVTDVI